MSTYPSTYVPDYHDVLDISQMKYLHLGDTGLDVSAISLGGAALGGVYGTNNVEECVKTVQAAIKSGINFIDTAYWYGQGKSEEILGKALKGVPRNAYYIATKVGRYETDENLMFDYSARKTISSVNDSLQRLGLDYVDIIQVHDVEFANSLDLLVNECLPTLEKIVQEGKARFIGITGYSVATLKKCIESSNVKISTVMSYARFTLINQTLDKYVPFFKDHDMGIINASCLAMGLLTNNGPQPWHPASDELKAACKNAAEYCRSHETDIARLALHYSFTREGPHTHCIGIDSMVLLENTLDIFRNSVSEQEDYVSKYLMENIFSKLTTTHWEGVEKAKLVKKLARKAQCNKN